LESLKLEELLPESRDEQAGLLKKISSAKLQVAELQLAVRHHHHFAKDALSWSRVRQPQNKP